MARSDAARPFLPRSVWRKLFKERQTRPTRPGRPRLECLEDRLVLSTFTVNSLLDANPPPGAMTLRQAILAANADAGTDGTNPDVINFSVTGTIPLNSQLPALAGNVMIGGPGASSLTVQGDHLSDRILTLGSGSTLSLSGLTLDGNGRFNSGISVGAGATLNLQNSVIQNVAASGNGGAIDNEAGGTINVSGVGFLADLSANFGGAIASIGGTATVIDSTFDHDGLFTNLGGAIYDSAASSGAGGSLTVIGCTFSNDQSPSVNGYGGAIDLDAGSTAVVADSTFVANSAFVAGGALSLHYGGLIAPLAISLDLSGSTVVDNSTPGTGGGVFVDTSHTFITTHVVLRDSIVAGNALTQSQGSQTVPVGISDVSGPVDPSSGFNIIGDGSGLVGTANTVNGNQIGSDASPVNPLLGPLQNNGGPTLTMAPLPGSPALDRGAPDSTLDALTNTDQAGNPRVVAQSFVVDPTGGDGRDIGAYELAAQSPTILVVNSLADANPPAGVLTLRQAIQAASGAIPLSALPPGQVTAGSPYVFELQFSVTGTIVLGSQLPTIANAGLILQGPGASSLTIQGDGLDDRILTVASGDSAAISGVTFLGPNHQNSGIVLGMDASLAVSNSVFQNTASLNGNGGAIDDEGGGGSVSVASDSFLSDAANGFGGAIDCVGGSLSVSTSTFSHNLTFSQSGAAIYDSGDSAAGGGGLSITGSTFSNGQSHRFGGAVALGTGTNAVISNSTFTANFSDDAGGAIGLDLDGSSPSQTIEFQLLNSTVVGNTGFAMGGGLFVESDNPALQVQAVLRESIVAGNIALSFNNGQPVDSPFDVSGPIDPSSSFNLIGDGSQLTGTSNGVNGNQIGTDAAPIDPKVGPLQNNGGPTLTMALLPGSPALDGGSFLKATATDQRGVLRGRTLDIGAYQATASSLQVTTSSPATAGVQQAATVEAFDSLGQPAFDDMDVLSFSSSDQNAVISGTAALLAAVDNFFVTFGTPGQQSITARDLRTGLSGTSQNVLVDQPAVDVDLTSSANPSVFGQTVTLTASVTAAVGTATPPGGSVTFLDGTKNLGTATLSNGSASISVASLAVGSQGLTAVYAGDAVFSGGTSAVLNQTVNKANSATLLTASPSPATVGQTVTLTATLSVVPPGGGTPQGTVTFRDGSATLGTARVNAAGLATFQTSALALGTHSLTAVWGGDSDYKGSTSPIVSETINPVSSTPTTTVLASNSNPSVYGEAVTFTATVSGPGGTPTGTATLMEGTKRLAAATLTNGTATFTDAALPAGSASLTVVYGGDAFFSGSTSAPLTQTVQRARTTDTLSVTPPSPVAGQLVTLTAVLAAVAPGGGIPQGTVTFHDGPEILGTARLNSSGVATLQTSTLPVGTNALTAYWGGDSNYFGSTSPVVTIVVGPLPDTTTLASAEAVLSAEASLLTNPIDPENGLVRNRN
jgi:hypothetical protein